MSENIKTNKYVIFSIDNFIKARDEYNIKQKKNFKNELIGLLREYKVDSKDKIKLLMEYYRRYIPNVEQKSIFKIFGNTFSFIIALSLSVISSQNSANIISYCFLIALIIAVLWSVLNVFCRFLLSTINGLSNYYLEIEETLTTLYLKFEIYENLLLEKNN